VKEFLRQDTPSISVFSTESVVPDVPGLRAVLVWVQDPWRVCKDAGEERETMVCWATLGQ